MDLQIFKSEKFGEIRTVEENGKFLFCGSDVAKALGYVDTVNALKQHCKQDGVVFHHITDNLGRTQQAKFINEGNLYRLIAKSQLPEAEQFERWIFDEVLPSIRKHGMYATAETAERLLNDPDFMIQTFKALKEERERNKFLNAKIEQDKPKVLFADAVSASKTSILVGDLAKLIKQNGYDIGANRLFVWLRENGYLIKRKGADYNMPTQKAMEMGLFEVKETSITHSDGHISVSKTPKVTGKGQVYFLNKFITQKLPQA
ncbi:MAG: phage antirepressor KilAC domain-containing protein [Oscillospiraceae bacterium]|nr:phage antirepressor KilAC domain-containing protein [Oscillospiraceae bacterium]